MDNKVEIKVTWSLVWGLMWRSYILLLPVYLILLVIFVLSEV